MCWTSYNKKISAKIAKQDIHTIKFVDNKFINDKAYVSCYRKYVYIKNKPAPKIKITPLNDVFRDGLTKQVINEGYHSYSAEIKTEIVRDEEDCNPTYICLYSTNGAYMDCFKVKRVRQVTCIIPKGTKYYVNENGEYVLHLHGVADSKATCDKAFEIAVKLMPALQVKSELTVVQGYKTY